MASRISRIANSIVVQALFLVVISRMVLYGVNWFSLKVMPPSWTEESQILGGWMRWDGGHYIRIAMNGYAGPGDPGSPAFFPLYPMLMRGLAALTGMEPTRASLGLAGIVISAGCFLVAVPLFARYVEERFGQDVSRGATLLLVVSPFSLFFGAVYTESLFLLLVVLVFVLAGKERWLLAAVVVALATATRVSGLALLPALLLMAWRASASRRDLATIALISPLGIVAFMAHTWRVLDDPVAFLTVQDEWGGWDERWGQFLDVYLRRPQEIFTGEHFYAVALLNLALFALCVSCLPMIWRRLDVGLALFSTLIMVQGMTSLISLGRYLLPAIGVYIVLAMILARNGPMSVLRQTIVISSVMLLTMLTILFAHDYWVI